MTEKTKQALPGGRGLTVASLLTMAAATLGSTVFAFDPARTNRRTEPPPRAKPSNTLSAEIRAWNEEIDRRNAAKLERKVQQRVQKGRRK